MTSRVIVSIRVAATPARAFDAFTQEIGAWWQASPLFALTPRGDGVVGFEPGPHGRLTCTLPSGMVFEVGKVRAWEPPVRLVFDWRQASFAPDQQTQVEVRFEPVGTETRVTVEHRGWDAIPQASAARHGFPEQPFLMRSAEYWRGHLRALQALAGGGAADVAGSAERR